METSDVEKTYPAPEERESGPLHRNRSFKSKQLVRSQAIRESASPPRTVSPLPPVKNNAQHVNNRSINVITNSANVNNRSDSQHVNVITNNNKENVITVNNSNGKSVKERTISEVESDTSSQVSRVECSDSVSASNSVSDDVRKQPVEIQITQGWDTDTEPAHGARRSPPGHLLSNHPRVACVCGADSRDCRGRRRKYTQKQDSGISDECPDCSDNELSGDTNDNTLRKSSSLDLEEDQSYCRCSDKKETPKNIPFTRADSDERAELHGQELINFIRTTLSRNPRDRTTLLRIERELRQLINDTSRCVVRFPVMTSYGRMLVHRCAALFQLQHRIDPHNKACVVVSKSGTSGGRVPCTGFRQWCAPSHSHSEQHRTHEQHKSILKRDAQSLDSSHDSGGASNCRSKSLEQREREYERARRRIFSTDNCSQDESAWPWLGPVKVLAPEGGGRNKLLKVQSLESSNAPQSWRKPQVSKSHSFGGYDDQRPQPRLLSRQESSNAPQSWRKPQVSKSHSFGGYDDQRPQPRLLSRQGDLASSSWRLSPSSSGYKTLSLRSTDSVTPSPTGGVSPEPTTQAPGALLWAFTDLSCVPKGALIIHPQTGQPLTNPDGSVYHYDPSNPPVVYDEPVDDEDKADQNNDKRRGRLEKQHSFIDAECELPPTQDDSAKQFFCDCQRPESCENRDCDKVNAIRQQEIPIQAPPSPLKTHYQPEVPPEPEPTNPTPPYEPPTNHRPAAPEPANQRAVCEPMSNRQSEVTSQRVKEESFVQQNYAAYENELQSNSPQVQQQAAGYIQGVQPVALKSTPVHVQDPNIRPMSLTGLMYPGAMPQQQYTYANQCRVEAPLQPPLYQPVAPPGGDEPKQMTHEEPAFRIDASYPYGPIEPYAHFAQPFQACAVEPPQHRNYGVTYTQPVEQTVMPAAYPLGNVILPQHYPQAQYQPVQQLQWQNIQPIITTQPLPPSCATPLQKPVTPPNMYLPQPDIPLYQPVYNQTQPITYPIVPYQGFYQPMIQQVIPQQYYQPVYHTIDNNMARRNSFKFDRRSNNSSRNTPLDVATDKVPYDRDSNFKKFTKQNSYQDFQDKRRTFVRTNSVQDAEISRRNSQELAMKIQQIKEQMAMLNTQENEAKVQELPPPRVDKKPEEVKRRNNGNGILGSYPAAVNAGYAPHQHQNQFINMSVPNEESQLSSAALAIVNSIRNIQTKNNHYHQNENRRDYQPKHHNSENYHHKHDYNQNYQNGRNRYHRSFDHDSKEAGNPTTSSTNSTKEDRPEGRREHGFGRRYNNVPFQYRQQYVFRQMSPAGTWCRRSPAPVPNSMNAPRRPPPDHRNQRR